MKISTLLASVDVHGDHIAEFGVIGHRADGPLLGFENLDHDARVVGQQRAAPAPGPERTDRREG